MKQVKGAAKAALRVGEHGGMLGGQGEALEAGLVLQVLVDHHALEPFPHVALGAARFLGELGRGGGPAFGQGPEEAEPMPEIHVEHRHRPVDVAEQPLADLIDPGLIQGAHRVHGVRRTK